MKKYFILGVASFLLLGAGCSVSLDTTKDLDQDEVNQEPVQEVVQEEVVKVEEKQVAVKPVEVKQPEVKPVVQPAPKPVIEEKEVEPVVEVKKVTCALGDLECFGAGIQNCTLYNTPFSFIGPEFLITAFDEGDNCRINHTPNGNWENDGDIRYDMYNGTYFDCAFSKANLKEDPNNYFALWSTSGDYTIQDNCVGTYIAAMDEFLNQSNIINNCGTGSMVIGLKTSFSSEDKIKYYSVTSISGENGTFVMDISGTEHTLAFGEKIEVDGHSYENVGTKLEECKINGVELEGEDCGDTIYMAKLKVDCGE